ncbi:MAG: M3 family metallopeptidase [Hyphomicrobiales bacterium]|nr:M3 family metallopeptidase [Hyphomicrobiales bacterium]
MGISSPAPEAASLTQAQINPFFEDWNGPFGLPPFAAIRPEHYVAAFERGMQEHDREIAAIVGDPAPARFENTVEALERAGRLLGQVGAVFWNLTGTDTTAQLQEIEREMAPKLAAHYSAIGMNEALFRRVEAVWRERELLDLTAEQRRVLDLTYESFVRSGVLLSSEQKKRYAEIAQRLATLGAEFSQNVLADESGWTMFLEEADLAGLPQSLRDGAARASAERGKPGAYAITLSRSSVEPFLTYSARRDLREKAFAAWTMRGQMGGQSDNSAIMAETIRLRDESARMLGYRSYAHYKLEDQMAKTPEHVRALLDSVWTPARARAMRERDVLQEIAAENGDNLEIAAHDWRYYSEKARNKLHNLDEAEIRAYLPLESVIQAAFDVAHKLFGVSFREVKDLALYHPEVRAFDVVDAAGDHVALFLGDYFARPSKRGGAWMSNFRSQDGLRGERPIVVNVMNFSKGAEGSDAHIGLDDARTLFHEFGHALHGMLSQTTYPSISGTSVARDFVEFPSQLYEHWFLRPEVLARFTRHEKTGAPMPAELVSRIQKARNFNQGFATVEYCSSAIVDLDLHLLNADENLDVLAQEKQTLARIGMPREIAMRHRCPHFLHIFSGPGYAAGYYAYLWSEVLDADGFAAFTEKHNVFDADVAARLQKYVYAAGGREKPDEAYRNFRGRDPDSHALLEKRGLA